MVLSEPGPPDTTYNAETAEHAERVLRLFCEFSGFSVDRRRFSVTSPRLFPEQPAQPRVAGAADRQTLAVAEHGDAVLALVQLAPRQPIEVEHERAMDADELRRIERRLDLGERLLLQVLLALAAEADVIVLRLHVLDFLDRQHVHPRAVADEDAARVS